MLNQIVRMVPAIFRSTRFKRETMLFPPVTEVTEDVVTCTRTYFFIKIRKSIRIKDVVSMHIKNCRFSSELLIKNGNGGKNLNIIGLRRSDAHRIRELVEEILGLK